MSTASLILTNYVVLVLQHVFTNVNLKDVKRKQFFLHNIGLLLMYPKEFLIVLHHRALFILTVIFSMSFI